MRWRFHDTYPNRGEETVFPVEPLTAVRAEGTGVLPGYSTQVTRSQKPVQTDKGRLFASILCFFGLSPDVQFEFVMIVAPTAEMRTEA